MAFLATVRDRTTSRTGIVRAGVTGCGSIIAERDAPTPSGSTYRNFLRPAINSVGDVAWVAFLGDGRRGVFRTRLADPGIDHVVVCEGSPAPIAAYQFRISTHPS